MLEEFFPPPYVRYYMSEFERKFCCQNPRRDKQLNQFFLTILSTVCDVLPLIINNHDVRLPANLLYKYLNKAAEFYINYVTRSTQIENQHQGK